MPYGMRYSSTSMFQIGRELEESAQTSGAGWFQTFRRVLLPLLVPGLVAGWIYIVVVSVRELSSTIILYSPGKEVLSIVIWEQYQNGELPQLAALGDDDGRRARRARRQSPTSSAPRSASGRDERC